MGGSLFYCAIGQPSHSETREKEAGGTHKPLTLALELRNIFFASLPTSFFTAGRKGSVVWNSWCGSYCKPGGDVNYLPRKCKPATGGQLSITSLQPQHGPLFFCSGLLIFSLFKWIFLINAFALSKGHPLGFVLSTDKFYSAHGQLWKPTVRKQTGFGSKHSRHRLSRP